MQLLLPLFSQEVRLINTHLGFFEKDKVVTYLPKASYRIKKLKEKKTRIDAKLLYLVEQNIDRKLDQTRKITKKQAMLKEKTNGA